MILHHQRDVLSAAAIIIRYPQDESYNFVGGRSRRSHALLADAAGSRTQREPIIYVARIGQGPCRWAPREFTPAPLLGSLYVLLPLLDLTGQLAVGAVFLDCAMQSTPVR